MNIFIVDKDPVISAQSLLDKHVVKMPLESAQLLCSAFPEGTAPYKRTHVNHPCSIWVRTSRYNFEWLVLHGLELCNEYTRRYGKVHASRRVIEWALDNVDLLAFTATELTPFVQAMPEIYRSHCAVEADRAYYLGAKKEFATWKSPAKPPHWWEVNNGN